LPCGSGRVQWPQRRSEDHLAGVASGCVGAEEAREGVRHRVAVPVVGTAEAGVAGPFGFVEQAEQLRGGERRGGPPHVAMVGGRRGRHLPIVAYETGPERTVPPITHKG